MISPRLLDTDGAAAYLGIGPSYIRAFVRNGDLVPVRLPATRGGGESRRLLFDVRDLDALVDRAKDTSTGAPNAGLSAASVKGWNTTPIRGKAASR